MVFQVFGACARVWGKLMCFRSFLEALLIFDDMWSCIACKYSKLYFLCIGSNVFEMKLLMCYCKRQAN